MGRYLHADAGMIEWTISGHLIGFSSGQLLWGPISDRYGRRLAVGSGLILFVIGSAGCALVNDALTMIGWRIVQTLGACASVALSRAMVLDLYQGTQAAQMLSTLITVMAIMPLVGPLVLFASTTGFSSPTRLPGPWPISRSGPAPSPP